MIRMSHQVQEQDDEEGNRSMHHSFKHLRITLVKHMPVDPDTLHRQFVALFDLLGMDAELFDNPSQDHTMEVQQ
jgi:hypothetical protein